MKTQFDYNKLRGLIREKFKTQANFAKFVGISEGQLYKIFNYNSYFNQSQISKIASYINATPSEIYDYFFTLEVEKNSSN